MTPDVYTAKMRLLSFGGEGHDGGGHKSKDADAGEDDKCV